VPASGDGERDAIHKETHISPRRQSPGLVVVVVLAVVAVVGGGVVVVVG
jgi:hypothetical protein